MNVLDHHRSGINQCHGFILAAGLGSRLLPLTQWLPKPLMPLNQVTLLELILEKFQHSGFQEVGLNGHHHSDLMERFLHELDTPLQCHYFHEGVLLDTAGGLRNASAFLCQRPLVLFHNADIISDLPLALLVQEHQNSKAEITLALVAEGPKRQVIINQNQEILSIAEPKAEEEADPCLKFNYAGIAVMNTALLEEIPKGPCGLVSFWQTRLLTHPGTIRGVPFFPNYWLDVGTWPDYFNLQQRMLQDGSLVLPHAVRPLPEQGSQRRYFRLGRQPSLILQWDPGPVEEFKRHVVATELLNRYDLGAPQLMAFDESLGMCLMEDLGPLTVFEQIQASDQVREDELETSLVVLAKFLVRFQTTLMPYFPNTTPFAGEVLDETALLGESDYFFREVAHLLLKGPSIMNADLEKERQHLAREVASHPLVPIHRDFQSKNLVFKEHKVRLLDYQGLRWGSVAYDLASLLFDPYLPLTPPSYQRPLQAFVEEHRRENAVVGWEENGERMLLEAACQRLLQAAGAYARLGYGLGKTWFRPFLPIAIERLCWVLDQSPMKGRYPQWRSFLGHCQQVVAHLPEQFPPQ
jgi:aminoglycoside/choline kinase family phosphotransferase